MQCLSSQEMTTMSCLSNRWHICSSSSSKTTTTRNTWQSPAWLAHSCAVSATWRTWL